MGAARTSTQDQTPNTGTKCWDPRQKREWFANEIHHIIGPNIQVMEQTVHCGCQDLPGSADLELCHGCRRGKPCCHGDRDISLWEDKRRQPNKAAGGDWKSCTETIKTGRFASERLRQLLSTTGSPDLVLEAHFRTSVSGVPVMVCGPPQILEYADPWHKVRKRGQLEN